MSLHPVLLEKLNAALLPAGPQKFTPRDASLPAIANKVHSVIGMRRTGKTTFLQQLVAERRRAASPEQAVYVNFDDERLSDLPLEQLGLLLEEYFRRFPHWRGRSSIHFFLDEIQLVDGWERFVRRVMDSERVQVVVSGSSARLLGREVHTALRGRGMETVIRPFGFREFLRHRGEEPAEGMERLAAGERSLVEKRFREYLAEGGFPEAQGLSPSLRTELLQGYVHTLVFRDVVERFGVTQVAALRWLVRQCLRNAAGLLSVHRLYRDMKSQGLRVAKDALHALLGHLLDAFLISAVPLATESERRRNSNPRKIFPADPAIVGAFDSSGRANLGHLLETVVLNELERRKAEVGYVRTGGGAEVDFYACFPAGRRELIQVCADISSPETRERERRALEEAAKEFRGAKKRMLVLEREQVALAAGTDTMAQTVPQWLLEKQP